MPFTEKPVQQGTHLKTRMIRVDSDFAAAIKRVAKAHHIKVTEVTRHLYEALYANGGNEITWRVPS